MSAVQVKTVGLEVSSICELKEWTKNISPDRWKEECHVIKSELVLPPATPTKTQQTTLSSTTDTRQRYLLRISKPNNIISWYGLIFAPSLSSLIPLLTRSCALVIDDANPAATTGVNELQGSFLPIRQAWQRSRCSSILGRFVARVWTEPYAGRDPRARGECRR